MYWWYSFIDVWVIWITYFYFILNMCKMYIKGTSNSQPSQNLWCGKIILACAIFSMLLCVPELYCIVIMWLESLHTSFFWGQIENICWDPEGMHSPTWDHPLAQCLPTPPSGLLSACSEPRTPCQSLPQQQDQSPAPHRLGPPCHGTTWSCSPCNIFAICTEGTLPPLWQHLIS